MTDARLHRPHHRVVDHHGGASAGDEHGADHQVGLDHRALDRATVRCQGHDAPAVDLVDPAQPVEVLVDQHDLGLHAGRDPRRVPADVAGAEHHDLGGTDAGCAAHEHAAAAVVALEVVGADLRREPAGDLAHRGEQREGAGVELHRLVRDAGGAGRDERLGDARVGGEVEVGEQREVGSQEAELLLLRLLHLHHQLLRPRIGGGGDDVGAGANGSRRR